jgi:hypothetical protein
MIADIVICSLAFVTYVPLCYFVSRAFGWTTFGADRHSPDIVSLRELLTKWLQLLLAAMISSDGFYTGFSHSSQF